MLKEMTGFGQTKRIAQSLHAGLVERARARVFFCDLAVADTIDGRFDMIAVHAWLLLKRLNDLQMRDTAQSLVDALFISFDEGLRELGVGDIGVGHRMKKIGDAFYGRLQAYSAAQADGDLATAILRNVYRGETTRVKEAGLLAAYLDSAQTTLATQTFSSGSVDFGKTPSLAD